MQAARLYGIGDLRVEEIAEPGPPQRDELVIAVEAAGICGSDLHNFKTGMWLSRVPSTPGHEFCGTVTLVGPQVSIFRKGDRVVADSRVFCGTCDMCHQGRPNLCRSIGYVGEVMDGGFAPLVKLGSGQVHRLPDQAVEPVVAAMTEPLAVALHAINRLAPRMSEPILVTGAGPIGAIAAIVLAHRGFGPLFVLDRTEARASHVAQVTGATCVTLSEIAGLDSRLAIETTGSAAVLGGIIAGLLPASRIASVGIFHGSDGFDLNRIVEGEAELAGCAAFRNELPEALSLLGALSTSLKSLTARPIALEDVPAAYKRLSAGQESAIKTMIMPRA